MENQTVERKRIKVLRSIRPTHLMWQKSNTTGEIIPAIWEILPDGSERLKISNNHSYVEALNKKNAVRKFNNHAKMTKA